MIYDYLFYGIPYLGGITVKQKAKIRSTQEYEQTLMHLINTRISQYKWEGLPDTCNARFLELCLLRGSALMAKEGENYLTLAAAPSQGVNLYGDTVTAYGYGMNGYNKEYTLFVDGDNYSTPGQIAAGQPDAVLCRDNPIMYPEIGLLIATADRMTYTMRSLDIVNTNLRTPTIIEADPKEVKSIKDMYGQIDDGVPAVFARRDNIVKNAEIYSVGQDPAALKSLWEHYQRLENNYRERVGIQTNADTDKKAQISEDEVNSNNQAISMSQNIYLSERQKFCEKINKVWGLNVKVSLAVEDKSLNEQAGLNEQAEREETDYGTDM